MKKKKVLFIASTGGHLTELMQLKPMFDKYDYHIITERTKVNLALRNKYKKRINFVIFGSKDHEFSYIFKLLANCFIELGLYLKIRPKYIVSTGAHIAGPMCLIGKIFGSKIIFIETFANRETRTLSGRLVYPIADKFIVQWNELLKLYPKAECWGWIF